MAAPINYAVMTYTSLTQQIIDYANRDGSATYDFVDRIPYFIFQAQQRIWRDGEDIGFEVRTLEATFVQNTAIIEKPANWNKTISFIYGDITSVYNAANVLQMRTYEFCRVYWPNSSQGDVTGRNNPLYYCDVPFNPDPQGGIGELINNSPYSAWLIAPTPYLPLKYQINYSVNVQNITAANTTNILTIKFPDILFYACMCEAFAYTQENERIQIFETLYKQSLQSMKMQTQDRQTDRASIRDKN